MSTGTLSVEKDSLICNRSKNILLQFTVLKTSHVSLLSLAWEAFRKFGKRLANLVYNTNLILSHSFFCTLALVLAEGGTTLSCTKESSIHAFQVALCYLSRLVILITGVRTHTHTHTKVSRNRESNTKRVMQPAGQDIKVNIWRHVRLLWCFLHVKFKSRALLLTDAMRWKK